MTVVFLIKFLAFAFLGRDRRNDEAWISTLLELTNPTSKQTFFYQIRLGAYRGGSAAGLHGLISTSLVLLRN